MKNYKEKFTYLANRCGWVCPIGKKKYNREDRVEDLHHKIIHNTKLNRKKFPLFIDSIFNCEVVNHDNHLNNPSWGAVIGAERIAIRWERFLKKHPKIALMGNGDFFQK